MIGQMTVSAMMMRRFSAIASVIETDDIDAVANKLAHHDIGAVVVLSTAGRLMGIITDGDLVKAFAHRKSQLNSLTAKDIMNADVHTCRSDETELEIMTVMVEKQIRHMVVMLGENVVGVVTLDEAVKQRIEKVKLLNEKAAQETNKEKRLALVDQHLKETWSIFEVFRAVSAVQAQTGLAKLDDRSKQLLWWIGEADNVGRPMQVKDLLVGHKLGTFPTVRRHLDELMEVGLIEQAPAFDGRAKLFQLSPRGRDVFGQMTKAVSDTIVPLATASCC